MLAYNYLVILQECTFDGISTVNKYLITFVYDCPIKCSLLMCFLDNTNTHYSLLYNEVIIH